MIFRDDPFGLVVQLLDSIAFAPLVFLVLGWWVIPLFLAALILIDRKNLIQRIAHSIFAVFICSAFFAMFTMLKSTMPFILPFWADPWMADLDRTLHLGTDPWELTHKLSDWLPADLISAIYYSAWLVPAMYLPVLMAMFDDDLHRKKRFTQMYLFTWIGLGNVVALAFLSAGPVFYDRIYGGENYAPMIQALADAQITEGSIGELIERLWSAYESGKQNVGSGISAFPSVHVGMATVVALYFYERHRIFLMPSVAIVAIYQVLSVHQGWHYAIDGYFSILAVVTLWVWLRRRDAETRLASHHRNVAAQTSAKNSQIGRKRPE